MSIILPYLKKENPRRTIVVETYWRELFHNNPHVNWVTHRHIKTTRRHIRPRYQIDRETTNSIYKQIMGHMATSDEPAPRLYLTKTEIEHMRERFPFPYMTICPVGKGTFTANRKEWGVDNFQRLRDLLGQYEFVQIGTESDPLLNTVIDGRHLTARQSAAVIHNSIVFIGLEGGLMHLAKAVGQKAVIIYGGFIDPRLSAYQENLNIYHLTDCSPCFHSNRPHDDCNTMKCMKAISPEMVYEHIQTYLIKNGRCPDAPVTQDAHLHGHSKPANAFKKKK